MAVLKFQARMPDLEFHFSRISLVEGKWRSELQAGMCLLLCCQCRGIGPKFLPCCCGCAHPLNECYCFGKWQARQLELRLLGEICEIETCLEAHARRPMVLSTKQSRCVQMARFTHCAGALQGFKGNGLESKQVYTT